jgi:signal transduction histidine kinase
MRERAAEIGARIDWTTAAAGGGMVRLDVPLRPADRGAAT